MRVLVDTNVFLNVLLDRREWAETSRDVLNRLEQNPGMGWIAWHTLSNLYYLGRKVVGEEQTRATMRRIVRSFEVCPAHGKIAVSPLAEHRSTLGPWCVTRSASASKPAPSCTCSSPGMPPPNCANWWRPPRRDAKRATPPRHSPPFWRNSVSRSKRSFIFLCSSRPWSLSVRLLRLTMWSDLP